jgi:hypothetical protein
MVCNSISFAELTLFLYCCHTYCVTVVTLARFDGMLECLKPVDARRTGCRLSVAALNCWVLLDVITEQETKDRELNLSLRVLIPV